MLELGEPKLHLDCPPPALKGRRCATGTVTRLDSHWLRICPYTSGVGLNRCELESWARPRPALILCAIAGTCTCCETTCPPPLTPPATLTSLSRSIGPDSESTLALESMPQTCEMSMGSELGGFCEGAAERGTNCA